MIYLILAAAVLVIGVGIVVVNRLRSSAKPVRLPAEPERIERTAVDQTWPHGSPMAVDHVDERAVATVDDPPLVDEPSEINAPIVAPSFRSRMAKARGAFSGALLGLRNRGITAETWDDLEEALLRADVGVRVTDDLVGGLRARVKAKEITEPDALVSALRDEMVGRLSAADRSLQFDESPGGPNVWLFVGVNGVGKTTTIGKVGAQQRAAGRSVLMAAGDTFRAAAAEQLGTWAERSGAELVRGAEGGDPSSVIFDGIERATARNIDLVLADTAGRLHTKTNLMDELRKVRRVAAKGAGRVTEVLLVIDATTGQNGLTQAREFAQATRTGDDDAGITGVVLTKLDGSAKGGIVFAIETEMGLPVKLVGLGETIGDLVAFDPRQFIDALVND